MNNLISIIFSKRTKSSILEDYQKLKEPNYPLRLFQAVLPAILLLIIVFAPHISDRASYLIFFFYIMFVFSFALDKINKKLDLLAELASLDSKDKE